MRTAILVGVFASASSGLLAAQTEEQRTVQSYCAGCHNGAMRSPSGALLDRFDTATIVDNLDVWSRAYRQLQAGTMPPVGAPRPDDMAAGRLLSSIETVLVATNAPTDATNEQIARRLATLLWNSAPDASLLDQARRHRLTQPDMLEKEIQRMFADERVESFVSRFFFPWLGLDQLAKIEGVPLRDAMVAETSLFIRSQLRDDRDPIALWDADYTFLNEPLARHYNVSGITGPQFRRVQLAAPERYGLLGQGSILTATSRPQPGKETYTSPAARAIWVRMHFLGAPAPRPFPNAQPVKPGLPIAPQTRTLPAEPCVNCHRNFFPLGYALEHFDATGGWRTDDQAGPVDASGTLADGTPFDGSVELRTALRRYADAFRTTITERLVIYASGRPLTGSRTSADTLVRARQVLRAAKSPRWSSIIAAMVRMNPSSSGAMRASDQTALVKTYCAVCHTDAARNGGLSLEHYDASTPNPPLAAMILSKLNNGAMGAAGKGVPDKAAQDAWVESTRAQAVGADAWFVTRDQGTVSASIVRAVPPRQQSSADRPVYRISVTCDPMTRVGEIQLTWSPQPQTGRTLAAVVDTKRPIDFRIEGKESMGNGAASQSGHASVILSSGKGGALGLPTHSLTIRDLFPGESIEFPFSDLDRAARSELRRCF